MVGRWRVMGFKELKRYHKSFATLLLPARICWEEPGPQRSAEVCKKLAFGINEHQKPAQGERTEKNGNK